MPDPPGEVLSAADNAAARRQRRPAHTLRVGLACVAVIAAVWLAVAGMELARAAGDLEAGRHALTRAQGLKLSDLVAGRPLTDLAEGGTRMEDAHRELGSVALAPLRFVPIAGRQLRSASALSGTAGLAAVTGLRAVDQGRRILNMPHGVGPDRVQLLSRLGDVAQRTEQRLAAVDLGPGDGLISPLARARDQLARKLTDSRAGLQRGGAAIRGLAQLLAGPRRYLVFGANNAEMRAGSGMFLSVGVLQTSDGRLQMSGVHSVTDVAVPPGAVPLGGDLAARWGWLQPNVEWRNLMLSPRFDIAAPLAARMWAASGNGPVDGVLVMDPVALKAILAATGSVSVAGQTIAADQVVGELLHEQYVRFPTGAQAPERQEELGNLAAGALKALDERSWSPERLAEGLSTAANGRHLLIWAARAGEEQTWTSAGVGGAMPAHSLLVAVLNRGANKLDYFLSTKAKLTLRPGRSTEATLAITLDNHVGPQEPEYVAGPDPGTGLQQGDYLGILSVTLPGQATQGRIDGTPQLVVAGPDGPTRVIGTEVLLAPGQSRTLVARFTLPGRHGAVSLEPSARIPQLSWRVQGRSLNDGHTNIVAW